MANSLLIGKDHFPENQRFARQSYGRQRCSKQRGAVMVVALVVIAVVSLASVASMQDVNTQSNMVRNEQLSSNAYQVAISEINAQLSSINLNAEGLDDPMILTLINQGAWNHQSQPFLGPDAGAGAYAQTLEMASLCEVTSCVAPPGYSLVGGDRVLQAEINSIASFPGSVSESDQSQGFWYLLPGTGGHIVTW